MKPSAFSNDVLLQWGQNTFLGGKDGLQIIFPYAYTYFYSIVSTVNNNASNGYFKYSIFYNKRLTDVYLAAAYGGTFYQGIINYISIGY